MKELKNTFTYLLPVAVVVAAILLLRQAYGPESLSFENLKLAAGWGTAVLLFSFGFVVVYKMFSGAIDLRQLVSEPNGDASISRFQLLIFTFVISMSLFLIIVSHKDGPAFPSSDAIPPEILALLGISAGSYVISKGIQKDITMKQAVQPPTISIHPGNQTVNVGETTTFDVTATGTGALSYQWQRKPPTGAAMEDIPGADQPSYTTAPLTAADHGTQYRCNVRSGNGQSVSNSAQVIIRGVDTGVLAQRANAAPAEDLG